MLSVPSDRCGFKYSVHLEQQRVLPASCLAQAEIKSCLIHLPTLLLTIPGRDIQ